MNKKHAKIYVVNGVAGRVVGMADSMAEVHDIIDEIIVSIPDKDYSNLMALNVLDVLPLSDLISYNQGDINIGDEENASFGDGDIEYKINSGYWSGKTFDDIDDLTDFLREQVREGEMTIDEVKEIEVVKTEVSEMFFESAWEDDGTYSIEVERLYEKPELRDIYERMGIEFEPSHEVTKAALEYERYLSPEQVDEQVDKKIAEYIENFDIISLNKPVEDIDDTALQFHIIKMLNRVQELQTEQQRRNASK